MERTVPAVSETNRLFSEDGYIVRQKYAGGFPYGAFGSDLNGCGWIAVYNLLHVFDASITPEQVHREMNEKLSYRGMRGTPMSLMRKTLAAHGLVFSLGRGREAALRLGTASRGGILRYWEGMEPHFVCYLRLSGDTYRFLNVNERNPEMTVDFARYLNERPSTPMIRIIALREAA